MAQSAGSSRAANFNPRLREGGDTINGYIKRAIEISIHASAKEATNPPFLMISAAKHFNPRLREGGDEPAIHFHRELEISIHASAREATSATSL